MHTGHQLMEEQAQCLLPALKLTEQIHYEVANDVESVVESWRLVHDVYRQMGMIDGNSVGVHTTPAMASEHAAVFRKLSDGELESTLTALLDGPQGLPLDSVYQNELDALRQQGRVLVEVGLFADARQLIRTADARPGPVLTAEAVLLGIRESLARLTSYCYHFGRALGASDWVIGVHPRHARFYRRSWGFQTIGAEREYPTVKNRAVVLMRFDWRTCLETSEVLPYAFERALNNPLPRSLFEQRYRFADDPRFAGSALERFLRAQEWMVKAA